MVARRPPARDCRRGWRRRPGRRRCRPSSMSSLGLSTGRHAADQRRSRTGLVRRHTLVLNAAVPGSPLQLHQLSYPDGQLNPLTRDVNDYDGISLAADRRTLIGSRRERQTDLSILDVDRAGRVMTGPSHHGHGGRHRSVATINWVGDRVLYANWVVDARQPAAASCSQDAQDTTASLDGRTLVFTRGNGLWKADSDGGRLTLLVSGEAYNPIVTPDNRSVIFLSSRTGQQSPWIISARWRANRRQVVDMFTGGSQESTSPRMGNSSVFAARQVAVESARCRRLRSRRLPVGRESFPASRRQRVSAGCPTVAALAYIEADDADESSGRFRSPAVRRSQLTHFEDRVIVDFDLSPDGTRARRGQKAARPTTSWS